MNKGNNLKMARAVYKPSQKVEDLVLKLFKLFDTPLPNGVVVKELNFEKGHLKYLDVSVKSIKRVDTFLGIEVHWYPKRDISLESDPFCSIYAFRYNTLKKLYREVKKVQSTLG